MSRAARLFACLALLAAASDARAGFLYTFTTDTAPAGGSLTGSFRVDPASLSNGLSATDIRDFLFTFTDGSGVTTLYEFDRLDPEDIAVDPATGVPLERAGDNFVFGSQINGAGFIQVTLNFETPEPESWLAIVQFNQEEDPAFYSGTGHWVITLDDPNAVPAPAGAVLALVGAGCLAVGRRLRRE